MEARKRNLTATLIILTALFVLAQIAFVAVSWKVHAGLPVLQQAFTDKIVFTRYFLWPITSFICAQIFLYAGLIYLIWFTAVSLAELFSFRSAYLIGVILWFNAAAAIMFLNARFVPHSFFAQFLQSYVLNNAFSLAQIKTIAFYLACGFGVAMLFAVVNMWQCFMRKQLVVRNSLMLLFLMMLGMMGNDSFWMRKNSASNQPNIFIISFDALRPDYLGFFAEKQQQLTPNFDAFLSSAVVFDNAYTPVARTSPSWAGVLTGRYPLHNGLRENNSDLAAISIPASLSAQLQKNGYYTIYATDDRLFNNIDKRYGFNQLIGPEGKAADFFFAALNDFPLSNLVVSSKIGAILFPYAHGNHASPHTYQPDNFLYSITTGLQQANNKPVFLAVHFDLTAWPHYWFNDGLAYDATQLNRYRHAVIASDELLAKFIDILSENKLLENAIVVLMSDHGISLGLHGDRMITSNHYQGEGLKSDVGLSPYAEKADVDAFSLQIKPLNHDGNHLFRKEDYGIDTSYGYGSDLLSVARQNKVLLAIKTYGFDTMQSHRVAGPTLLLDVAPTLLDLLHLPALQNADGISLKKYLFDSRLELSSNRDIYFESTMSPAGITQKDININAVVNANRNRFEVDPKTGLIHLLPSYLNAAIKNKQRALMWEDWFLAFYPAAEKTVLAPKQNQSSDNALTFATVPVPSYFVLVNMKTGEWKTGKPDELIKLTTIKNLKEHLYAFYGQEMNVY